MDASSGSCVRAVCLSSGHRPVSMKIYRYPVFSTSTSWSTILPCRDCSRAMQLARPSRHETCALIDAVPAGALPAGARVAAADGEVARWRRRRCGVDDRRFGASS